MSTESPAPPHWFQNARTRLWVYLSVFMVLELGFGSLLLFGDTDLTWFQAFVSGPVPVTGFVAAISEVLALKQYHRLLEKNVSERVQAVHGDPAYLRFHSAVVVLEMVREYLSQHAPSEMSEMVLAQMMGMIRKIDQGEFEEYFDLNVSDITGSTRSLLELTVDKLHDFNRVILAPKYSGPDLDDFLEEDKYYLVKYMVKLRRIYLVYFSYILKEHSRLNTA